MLVSWTRALSGDWRDPVVGRDLIVGCAVAVLFGCLDVLTNLMPGWLGYPAEAPIDLTLDILLRPTAFLARVSSNLLSNGLFFSMACLFLFFLLRVALRNDWGALVLWTIVFPLMFSPILGSETPWVIAPIILVSNIAGFMLLKRVGLGAFLTTLFVSSLLHDFPLTFHASAWYAGYGYAALAIVAAIALYGFKTSLGGRPLVAGVGLDDA
jgi:serine/threonine-protein kinase